MSPCDREHTTSYSLFIETMHLLEPLLRYNELFVKLQIFPIWHPIRGWPHWIHQGLLQH